MKILFLPNWKVKYCDSVPSDKQPPDYFIKGQDYWFFRYFEDKPEVDVLDIRSFPGLEKFEKNKIRFYIWQALRAIPKLNKYDLIVSHGMQSGVVISLWRRLFKTKSKHLVFDIGAFNSAAESGFALKLMQYASKSIDGIIYHTSSQKGYYEKFFPWVVDKSKFIRFGTDSEFFGTFADIDGKSGKMNGENLKVYCICVGYSKRDWDTVIKAFQEANVDGLALKMVGHVEEKYSGIKNVEQIAFIPIKDLMKEIAGSKFGILPLKSYNYSYGQMTLMQQMSMGKCVIASRVPSLVDYGEDNETVVFYEPENVSDLAEKIRLVNFDDEARTAVGVKAAGFIQNECNEKTMASEIEKYMGGFYE